MSLNVTILLRRAKYKALSETVTSGALALACATSFVSVSGTKAYSLADGQYDGQVKNVICSAAGSTPAGTLTPATPYGFATVLFDAVGESVELTWFTGKGWAVTGRGALSAAGATVS